MAFWSAVGAIAPALGGLIASKSDQKAQNQMSKADWKRTQKMRKEDRNQFKHDKRDDRAYFEKTLKNDRAYAERMLFEAQTRDDMLTQDHRDYLAGVRYDERQYMARQTADERAYMAARLKDDRAYSEKRGAADYKQYTTDRAQMQALSDKQAERVTASRGVDFVKLRDDAMKAGYNPMTALAMAHAYSTEVGYHNSGQTYAAGPNFYVPGAGYNAATHTGGGQAAGGPAGGGGGAMPMGSGLAPGGFQTPGSGYTSNTGPALTSAGFVAEALQRGIETFANTPPARDPEAEAVMQQVQQARLRAEAEATTPRQFGYDLTKIAPYRPAGGYGGPDFDPVHNRPYDVEDTRDTPITTMYDLGDGTKVRGLNPDLDSEAANTLNAAYVYGHALANNAGKSHDARVAKGRAMRDHYLPRIKAGIGSWFATGSQPWTPSLRSDTFFQLR